MPGSNVFVMKMGIQLNGNMCGARRWWWRHHSHISTKAIETRNRNESYCEESKVRPFLSIGGEIGLLVGLLLMLHRQWEISCSRDISVVVRTSKISRKHAHTYTIHMFAYLEFSDDAKKKTQIDHCAVVAAAQQKAFAYICSPTRWNAIGVGYKQLRITNRLLCISFNWMQ